MGRRTKNKQNLAAEVGYLEQIAGLDRHNFDLRSLLKAGEALHNELEVLSLCKLLMAMAHERLHINKLAVLVHNEDMKQVRVEACMGLPSAAQDVMFPTCDGILWRLVLAGEPFSVVDLSGVPRFERVFREHGLEMLEGQIWVPLVIMGRVVGVLSVGSHADGKRLPLSELEFISALASQAAVALSTARLYQLNAIARVELDRSLHKLSMLFNVTRAMSAVSDLTQLLRLILEQAVNSVTAEKGSLMLLDEDTDELVIRVVFGLPDKDVERKINDGEIHCKRFARGEGVAGKVLATGSIARINKVEQDKRFTRRGGSHVDSILCVPLTMDSEVLGVINITNRKDGGSFRSEDEEILLALANQAAVAIARTRLYEAAITDSLTGLFVRRYIMHRCKDEVRRSVRYKIPLTMIMCDIDHFKAVNDTHGHPAGDAVIRVVGQLLKADLREVDCAGRYGGEEFLLLLPQTTAEMGLIAAERLRVSVEEAAIPIGNNEVLKVTMSFGVSEVFLGHLDESPEKLLQRADEALYSAKNSGRNQVGVRANPTPLSLSEMNVVPSSTSGVYPTPPELITSVHSKLRSAYSGPTKTKNSA